MLKEFKEFALKGNIIYAKEIGSITGILLFKNYRELFFRCKVPVQDKL